MNDMNVLLDFYKPPVNFYEKLDPQDAQLIFNFFVVFSRFEYALKKAGFWRGDENYVSPAWKDFSREIEVAFNPGKTEELLSAFNYYLSSPPRIPVLDKGFLGWKENIKKDTESDFVWVIRSIGIVRNNLFHGHKFPWNWYRDPSLLKCGLIILYESLTLHDGVNKAFFE